MWNPPIALTLEEQNMAARPRQRRQCFVLLRERRHDRLDADFQHTLAKRESPEPTGNAPLEGGRWALALLVQAYCHVSAREAGERTVMDQRWQMVLDGLGTAPPPCSQGPLGNFRRRLMAHNLDKTLLDRPVTWAEQTGGCGARQRRAALASTPLGGAGRVEDTVHWLGQAWRKAVGLVAQALGTSVAGLLEEGGLTWVGHRRLQAALDLNGGEPRAQEQALRLVREEVDRWPRWREQHQRLPAPPSPLREVREPRVQMGEPAPAPAPAGGPGGRRIKPPGGPDRRLSIEDQAMRHGRKSRAKTCHGFKAPLVLALDRRVTREVVVRPAHEPADAVVEWGAAAREQGQGLLPLDLDLGDMARPRLGPWAAPGVDLLARPWPCGGPCGTKHDFRVALAHGTGTWPGGQTVPMLPGRAAQWPARACDVCPQRAQCTTAPRGPGRTLTRREDEPVPQKLRAKLQTKRGRASLRKRTAVEEAIAHHVAPQGRRARSKGLRKNQCDGRRHAAVSNLQGAASYEEQRQLAS
jgi:Transposase DDE domain